MRQRLVFFLVFLVAFGAVVAATLLLPKEYEATAMLSVSQSRSATSGASGVEADEVLTEANSRLAQTSTVRREVNENLPFAADLESSVSVDVVTGAHLLEVTAADEIPRRAQVIANTYASTFVDNRTEAAERTGRRRLDILNERIASLLFELEQLGETTDGDSGVQRVQLENELEAARASYATTQENVTAQANSVSVISEAGTPSSPARPKPALYLPVGFVFSLILAAAAALIRNTFDRRIRNEDQVVELVGAPVLTRLPARGGAEHAFEEGFYFLRTNIALHIRKSGARLVAVTSAAPEEGKTTVSLELARALASADRDRRVVLVDCDLRNPGLSRWVGLNLEEGMAEAIRNPERAQSLLRRVPGETFDILAAAGETERPQELLNLRSLAELLAKLADHADWIVVDTAPVTLAAESASACALADAALLVVDPKVASSDEVVAATEHLAQAGAKLQGIVMNRVPVGRMRYGYYGGGPARADGSPEQGEAGAERNVRAP